MFRFDFISFILGCLVGATGIQFIINILNKILEISK